MNPRTRKRDLLCAISNIKFRKSRNLQKEMDYYSKQIEDWFKINDENKL